MVRIQSCNSEIDQQATADDFQNESHIEPVCQIQILSFAHQPSPLEFARIISCNVSHTYDLFCISSFNPRVCPVFDLLLNNLGLILNELSAPRGLRIDFLSLKSSSQIFDWLALPSNSHFASPIKNQFISLKSIESLIMIDNGI